MDAMQNVGKRIPIIAISSLIVLKNNDESDSSSDSESENEELSVNDMQTLFSVLMANKSRGKKITIEKITDYVDRVIPHYNENIFKEHFRMYPATCEMVLSLIGPALNATGIKFGRKPISAEKQLYIALWFMATPDSYRYVKPKKSIVHLRRMFTLDENYKSQKNLLDYLQFHSISNEFVYNFHQVRTFDKDTQSIPRSVCVKFGVSKATAFRAVRRVTYALHCIAPRFIQWPNELVAANIMEQFKRTRNFPNVIGAIDGTHIKIRAPSIDSFSYINRKGFSSLNVQVVCDSRGLFTHCYAGEVGSVHDARVFRNSPIVDFLQMPDKYFPNDAHIIGDAAYPIHSHVMVPFRDNGHLTNRQKNFNYCLSATRMAVERAIGQLKIRFRILLDCLPLTDVKKIPEFIIACCVLHNICILKNDVMTVGIRPSEELQVQVRDNNTVEGNAKRIRIMNALQMQL